MEQNGFKKSNIKINCFFSLCNVATRIYIACIIFLLDCLSLDQCFSVLTVSWNQLELSKKHHCQWQFGMKPKHSYWNKNVPGILMCSQHWGTILKRLHFIVPTVGRCWRIFNEEVRGCYGMLWKGNLGILAERSVCLDAFHCPAQGPLSLIFTPLFPLDH